MALESIVFSVLSGASAITALVPVSRIKVTGDYQALDRPYIIHRSITKTRTYIHTAPVVKLLQIHPSYQINVVADTLQAALVISDAVEEAMDGGTNGVHSRAQFLLNVREVLPYDTDRKLQEIALDYRATEHFS